MHLLSWARFFEMTGVSSNWLACCTARQQSKKNPKVFSLGYDFFNSHTGDVHIGQLYTEISVAFIRAHHYFTRFCDGKIDTGNGNTTRHKTLA